MAYCYNCGANISNREGYRREVYTGSSARVYFSKRMSSSYGAHYGVRTVCKSCAKRIDESNKNARIIFLLLFWIIGIITSAVLDHQSLAMILFIIGIIGLVSYALVNNLDNNSSKHSTKQTLSVPPAIIENKQSEITVHIPCKPVEMEILPIDIVKKDDETADKNKPSEKVTQYHEELLENYNYPPISLLDTEETRNIYDEKYCKEMSSKLFSFLLSININVEDITATPGSTFTLFEFILPNEKDSSSLRRYRNDLLRILNTNIIEFCEHIPDRKTFGIAIVNIPKNKLKLIEVIKPILMSNPRSSLQIILGRTLTNNIKTTNLLKMPHLLIGGTTGTGKSVAVDGFILGFLFAQHPTMLKFLFIDTKKISFNVYSQLKSHFLAVSPDIDEDIITTNQNAIIAFKNVRLEIQKRWSIFTKLNVRDIDSYNDKMNKYGTDDTEILYPRRLPYLLIVIDDFAEIIISSKGQIEEDFNQIVQQGRAVGVHLIVIVQRPSVDILAGLTKANFPSRIAFKVVSKIDSRTILDTIGAENLLGDGDMLYLDANTQNPIRIQNPYTSFEEIERVLNFISTQNGYQKPYTLPSLREIKKEFTVLDLDPMFEEAARIIVRHQQGSVSLLQRRLKLGYSRAAMIVDQLEQAGIVGPSEGSKAREVIIENEEQLHAILISL